MSLETWIEEFYPTPADYIFKDEAIDHCLKKWLGLTPKNLKKHRVTKCKEDNTIFEGSSNFGIDCNTCALCFHYAPPTSKCPLLRLIGQKECVWNCVPQYLEWVDNNNPKPMINLLQKAQKMEELKKKRMEKLKRK